MNSRARTPNALRLEIRNVAEVATASSVTFDFFSHFIFSKIRVQFAYEASKRNTHFCSVFTFSTIFIYIYSNINNILLYANDIISNINYNIKYYVIMT